MSKKNTDLSVVIPVYRNPTTLRPLYDRLISVFYSNQIDYEIIFINDSCPENSHNILLDLSHTDKRIKVVSNTHNIGQNKSILAGLKKTTKKNIIIMDADLQDPPEMIPLLLNNLKDNVSVVFAGRIGSYQSKDRMISSRVFKTILSMICHLPKNAGIFLLMKKNISEKLINLHVKKPFIVAMIGILNVNYISVPVIRNLRLEGKSSYSSRERLSIAATAIFWALGKKTMLILKGENEFR